MHAKLVNLITVFSKTGERCQNNTDVSANVKGMNYFYVALYAKSITELQKKSVCHFYTCLGKDKEYYELVH